MCRLAKGFTLIELMIVVALLAIMLVIAVPSFASFISNYRATAAINDLLQAVTQARAEALKRGRKVVVFPRDSLALTTYSTTGSWSNGWAVFQLIPSATSYDSASTINPPVSTHEALRTSITIGGAGTAVPFNGRNYVAFDGSGYPGTNVSGANVPINAVNSGIVLTDVTGPVSNARTLCLAVLGRPRIVKAVDPCLSG